MNCKKIKNLNVIPLEIDRVDYMSSDSQIYIAGLGTLGRTGMCAECNAAIYQQERSGKTFPESLHGRRFHATNAGLVEL